MSENKETIKTTQFEFVEEMNIKKTGKDTFWYTRSNKDGFNSIVSDSLSYNKEDAEKMFHLIVECGGVMKEETILKTIEVVVK